MAFSKTTLASAALVVVLLAAAAPRPADGLIIDGIAIARVNISGILYCTVAGNPDAACAPDCPPIGNVPVLISCDGGQTTLTQVVTDPAGVFKAAINLLDTLSFDASACAAYVKLPVARCAALPPTGNLQGLVKLVNVVQGLLGGTANFLVPVFQLVH